VFEDWPVTMCPPTRRVVDPPKPVLVDLSRLIVNPDDTFRRDEVALRIKTSALRVERPWMSGRQIAWMRRSDGGWWC